MPTQSFYPPKLNNAFLKLSHALASFFLKDLTVQISDEALQKIRELQHKHILLLPNHPTSDDPFVLLNLTQKLGIGFNSVAARETFDWNYGLRGKMFQMLGCYSLVRGAPDRESFMTTKSLLVKGERPLVIFIEGEISNQNDVVTPFEPGVVQLAFKAQEELQSKNESVHLMPIALKYKYAAGIDEQIQKSICRLEKATESKSTADDIIERIRSIGHQVLVVQERRLNLKADKPDHFSMDLSQRIDAVKNQILIRLESYLDIRVSSSNSMLERIRTVRNTMDKLSYAYDKPDTLSAYAKTMSLQLEKTFDEFYDELDRLVNFLVFDGLYLSSKNSPERIVEVLRRLEKEVFGKVFIKHPRTCNITVGQTLALKDSFEEYTKDKKSTTKNLTALLEQNMAQMLAAN
jgi:1-acyl-sn-glycerol-3-phosphate acyltransferase